MGFIFGVVNLNGGSVNPEDVRTLGKAVQWDDFENKIEINSSYGWGYCWNKKRAPKAGFYTSERVAVLCDARIYNNDELKQSFEFELPEEAFVKAYSKWGDTFADKFSGDFAAVIIDFQQQKVLLVRDHIGVRPLTYSVKDDLLIFASHEFGIAKSNLVDNAISESTLIRSFFPFKKQQYSSSIFRNIKKITPGFLFAITAGRFENIEYWQPSKIKKNKALSFNAAVLSLRQHLLQSVQVRITSGNIGAHVSGGIDSSGVAAILANCIENKGRLRGFSWSPEEKQDDVKGVNEKQFVNDFVRDKQIPVNYLFCEGKTNIDDFILPEFEQMPIEIYTMRQLCQYDICSLFSGWGGDEFVSLSLRGAINHFIFRLKIRSLYRWIKSRGIKAALYIVKRDILPVLLPFGLFDSSMYKNRILKYYKLKFIFKNYECFCFCRRRHFYGFGNRKKLMLRLLYNYHLPQRMDSWALFGEQYGVEYKFPLLDKDLLNFWFTIPIRFTYEGMIPRFLYKEAMAGILTDSIRNRNTKDEDIFQQYWFRNYLKLKKELARRPEMFSDSSYLSFFKSCKFYQNTIDNTENIVKVYMDMYDIRFFLRYKSLVEKYVATNPYCMKKQKTNSDKETL
jgi:asparagine synthase (glutamine-hydrolysing)